MRYLIFQEGYPPFYTSRSDWENILTDGMVVIDGYTHSYSYNGKDWTRMEQDHL